MSVPASGVVVIPVGGRVNYCVANKRLAYDRRTTGASDPKANGWFNIYTSNQDGSGEQAITLGMDFDWTNNPRRPKYRHVGLPTWSHDGQYLLACVEEIDNGSPASLIDDPASHVPMQPGRGVINSIILFRLADKQWWWLWRYANGSGAKGSMHPYFSPDDTEIVFSRMLDYSGPFATWDIAWARLQWNSGTPRLSGLRYFTPIQQNTTQPPLAEVNGWDTEPGRICVSGNPMQGQQQLYDDVFTCDLNGFGVTRVSTTSGVNGEAKKYDEHLVPSPDGKDFAWMSSVPGGGTDVFVVSRMGGTPKRVSFFNADGNPMYVTPQGGSTTVTAARPTWLTLDDGTVAIMTTALNYPPEDAVNGSQGPIIMFNAYP